MAWAAHLPGWTVPATVVPTCGKPHAVGWGERLASVHGAAFLRRPGRVPRRGRCLPRRAAGTQHGDGGRGLPGARPAPGRGALAGGRSVLVRRVRRARTGRRDGDAD